MKRHPIYDQWGPAQKIPVAIIGIIAAVPFAMYLFGFMSDPMWAIVGALILAVVASTQRCGHLASRINDLEDRMEKKSMNREESKS